MLFAAIDFILSNNDPGSPADGDILVMSTGENDPVSMTTPKRNIAINLQQR